MPRKTSHSAVSPMNTNSQLGNRSRVPTPCQAPCQAEDTCSREDRSLLSRCSRFEGFRHKKDCHRMTQQCPSSLLGEKLKAYIGRGLQNPITGPHNPILLDDAISYAYDMFLYPVLSCHLWEEKDRWVACI